MNHHFDFTDSQPNLKPTVDQIVNKWAKAGMPAEFSVSWGETEAEFVYAHGRWDDSGNGCRGVDRHAVIRALEARERSDAEAQNNYCRNADREAGY